MASQKGFLSTLTVGIMAIALILIAGFAIVLTNGFVGFFDYLDSKSETSSGNNQVACTQDAKLCPDGSSVSRTGPNCEFAPCPSSSESTNIEKTSNELKLTPLRFRFFKEKFQKTISYPKEMTSLSRTDLKEISCSNQLRIVFYEATNSEPELVEIYDDNSNSKLTASVIPQKILDEITKKKYPVSMLYCDTGDSYIITYHISRGRENIDIDIVAQAKKEPFAFIEIAQIPSESVYFDCYEIHALTAKDLLYLECGGGDVDYSHSLYRIDLIKKVKTQLLNCSLDESLMFDICVNESGQEIYRMKLEGGRREVPYN